MENTFKNNNAVVEAKETKGAKIFAWISLVIATLMIAYICYHIVFKGFQFVNDLLNVVEDPSDSRTMTAIVVVIFLQPLAKFGLGVFLYVFIIAFGLLVSAIAFICVKLSLKIIASKSTANIRVDALIISTIFMIAVFAVILIR